MSSHYRKWMWFALASLAGMSCAPAFSEWEVAQRVPGTLNGPYDDVRPTLSPDGLSLYFGSNRPGGPGGTREGTDLYVARRPSVDAPFGPPVLVSALSSPGDDNAPSFSADGRRVVFGSDRSGGCGGLDLWAAERLDSADDRGWSMPRNMGCTLNSPQDDDGPTYFEGPAGRVGLLFASTRPGGPGGWDVYESIRGADGEYQAPALVGELSSPGRDTRTALRRDGLELVLTSNRVGGFGETDLWVCTRIAIDQPWGPLRNLGARVNGPAADGAPTLSTDGATLYFDSSRAGGQGGRDLYWTRRSALRR